MDFLHLYYTTVGDRFLYFCSDNSFFLEPFCLYTTSFFVFCSRHCYQAKEVTRMAKITIEELYRGEKYDIMSAVTAKALQLGIDERTEEGRTWIEMELVRQTVKAIEQMKKNGDCIAEGELGDAVTVSV